MQVLLERRDILIRAEHLVERPLLDLDAGFPTTHGRFADPEKRTIGERVRHLQADARGTGTAAAFADDADLDLAAPPLRTVGRILAVGRA